MAVKGIVRAPLPAQGQRRLHSSQITLEPSPNAGTALFDGDHNLDPKEYISGLQGKLTWMLGFAGGADLQLEGPAPVSLDAKRTSSA
jgi:hypothetical protein